MDREAFKKRMQSLKSYRENNPGKGYWEWRNSLPDNLKYTDDSEYNMRAAYESGALPMLEKDGLYHLPTRDPNTGRILKSSIHPTYWKGLAVDAEMGYEPYWIGNLTYTRHRNEGPLVPWKVELFLTGGEKTSIVNGVRINPYTGKPIATGSITPVINLEDAANFTPIGDVLTVKDAYTAARNRDWLGLGLAGLGIVPFIPTVNKGAISSAIDKVLRRQTKANKTLEEFNRQRDDVYESLIENEEAFRRAANADRTSGSNYLGTYQLLIREHGSDNLRDKVRMEFDPNLYGTSTKALVNPNDPTYITVNTRYKDPDELDDTFKQMNPGLIRHEMGHITDVRAGLDYTNKLADPAKFVSDEKLKEMFPSNYKAFRTKILNRGSEIKSYMNEFRQFLYDHGDRDTKETVKSFRRKLDAYGKDFKNLRMIFDSYKNPKQFIKDYNSVPLTSTDRNENLV